MPERPPDPNRPLTFPRGRPFAGIGRPGFAAFVMAAIAAAVVALIVVFLLT